jgi:5-methylcytosine-specific restriction endonuclease McrA
VGERTNTRRMHVLRQVFFEDGKRLDAEQDSEANCWLCQLRIDYSAAPNTTPESHNLDHFFPVDDYPELQEDPTNFRHAHMLCNGKRGKSAPTAGLGAAVPDWW